MITQAERLEKIHMPAYTHFSVHSQSQQHIGCFRISGLWSATGRDSPQLHVVRRHFRLDQAPSRGRLIRFRDSCYRKKLGFSSLSQNSIDAVGDRDFVAELLFVITLAATHLSRLSEDLILFGSSEFGFIRFGEAFTTGSSMMPQKRNQTHSSWRGDQRHEHSALSSQCLAC
jgi:argininosuccinate lyase